MLIYIHTRSCVAHKNCYCYLLPSRDMRASAWRARIMRVSLPSTSYATRRAARSAEQGCAKHSARLLGRWRQATRAVKTG